MHVTFKKIQNVAHVILKKQKNFLKEITEKGYSLHEKSK